MSPQKQHSLCTPFCDIFADKTELLKSSEKKKEVFLSDLQTGSANFFVFRDLAVLHLYIP